MKRQFIQFIVRWALNSAGIFVAALFLDGVTYQDQWHVLLIAALILSVVNALIKPLVIILALPALILTLGIFSLVINGFMVYLAHVLYSSFEGVLLNTMKNLGPCLIYDGDLYVPARRTLNEVGYDIIRSGDERGRAEQPRFYIEIGPKND